MKKREAIFKIQAGNNDTLDYGCENIIMNPGEYTGIALAAEIQKQLKIKTLNNYTVTYENGTFFIKNNFIIFNNEKA